MERYVEYCLLRDWIYLVLFRLFWRTKKKKKKKKKKRKDIVTSSLRSCADSKRKELASTGCKLFPTGSKLFPFKVDLFLEATKYFERVTSLESTYTNSPGVRNTILQKSMSCDQNSQNVPELIH